VLAGGHIARQVRITPRERDVSLPEGTATEISRQVADELSQVRFE
jgi:hypothetical protein